jgi:POT family proton-dependent oligopeptide transporter
MVSPRVDQIRHARPAASFLAHPRGLIFLFATVMCERFAYFGTLALLNPYLARDLLLPDHADRVLGLGALRAALESGSGPLAVAPFASQIFDLYLALVSLAPILGGLLDDRLLGHRRGVITGAVLLTAGTLMLAFEPLSLIALDLLIVGGGMFQPSILSQVGSLYAPGDPRRDRGYAIVYAGVGIGAVLGPLVCGTLAEEWGWPYGFAAAGLAMLIGLLVYAYAAPALPDGEHTPAPLPAAGSGWGTALALAMLLVPATLFWAAHAQHGNSVALWADDYTDRTIDLGVWHGDIPLAWFQTFNPLLIIALTPFVISFWSRQQRRGREPSSLAKLVLGCLMVALSYLVMAGAALSAAGDEASWRWLAAYFIALTLGEIYFAPIALSLVSKAARARLVATMMGLWLAAGYAGGLLSGWLGGFWSAIPKTSFFLMLAGLAALASVIVFSLNRPLRNVLGD